MVGIAHHADDFPLLSCTLQKNKLSYLFNATSKKRFPRPHLPLEHVLYLQQN